MWQHAKPHAEQHAQAEAKRDIEPTLSHPASHDSNNTWAKNSPASAYVNDLNHQSRQGQGQGQGQGSAKSLVQPLHIESSLSEKRPSQVQESLRTELREGKPQPIENRLEKVRNDFARSNYGRGLIVTSFALAVAEAIVVGIGVRGIYYALQIYILAASGVLFIASFFAQAQRVDDDDAALGKIILDLFDGVAFLEFVLMLIGWAFLVVAPGVAALRCLRLFRYAWYSDLIFKLPEADYVPEDHFTTIPLMVSLARDYLRRVGMELFSASTNGGVVVLGIFFFMVYIMAVVFWYDEADLTVNGEDMCDSLMHCFITMLRLSFYDAMGLDFLSAVIEERKQGYTVILVLFLCFNSMVLLNALVGVFGVAIFYRNAPQQLDLQAEAEAVGDDRLLHEDSPTTEPAKKMQASGRAGAIAIDGGIDGGQKGQVSSMSGMKTHLSAASVGKAPSSIQEGRRQYSLSPRIQTQQVQTAQSPRKVSPSPSADMDGGAGFRASQVQSGGMYSRLGTSSPVPSEQGSPVPEKRRRSELRGSGNALEEDIRGQYEIPPDGGYVLQPDKNQHVLERRMELFLHAKDAEKEMNERILKALTTLKTDVDGMKQNMGAMRRELDAVVDQMFKPTQHQAQSSRGRYAASSGPRKSNAFV